MLTGCLSDDAFLIVLFRTGALGSGRIEMTGVRPLLIYNLLPNNHSSYYQHARTRMLGTTIKNTGKRCRTLTTSVAPRANTFEARTLRNSSHLSPYIDMAKSRLFGNAIGYTKLIANEINFLPFCLNLVFSFVSFIGVLILKYSFFAYGTDIYANMH